MKKIVIFAQNRDFFGAQIVHIPMIRLLKSSFSDAKIYFFSKNGISNILKELNLVDELIIEKGKLQTIKEFRKINPDLTISLRKKSSFLNFLIFLTNQGQRVGFQSTLNDLIFSKTNISNPNIYRADNYIELITKTLKIKTRPRVKQKLKDRIIIIPGAGGEHKIWSLDNYLKIAKNLEKEVAFVIGKKEEYFIQKIKNAGDYKIYFDTDIKTLFDIIQTSKQIIANDCGPSHIAQISDTNSLILYSDEYNDAKKVIREWFNQKDGNSFLIGKKGESIDTILVDDILKLNDTIDF